MKNAFKLTAYTIVLFFAIGTGSCKKNDDNANWQAQAAEAETYRIKKHTYIETQNGNATTETNYTYNTDNTIATETNGTLAYTYTYANGLVLKVDADNGNVFETYHLNADGFVDTLSYDEYNYFSFTYNDYGTVTSKDFMGMPLFFNWSNGNLTSAGNGGMANYDFITDKFSTVNSTNRGMLFMGRESVNLPSRGYSDNFDELHFYYEFDDLQRVTRRTTEISDETFTYY